MTIATVDVPESIGAHEASTHGASEDVRRLHRRMLEQVTTAENKAQALCGVANILAEYVEPVAIIYFERDEVGRLSRAVQVHIREVDARSDRLAKQMLAAAEAACQEGEFHAKQQTSPPQLIVAAPIVRRKDDPEALTVIFAATSESLDQLAMLVQVAAGQLVLWHMLDDLRDSEAEAQETAAMLELTGNIAAAPNLRGGCYALANELREFLDCRRVAVGLRQRAKGPCRLQAISEMVQFDKRSETARAIETALDETVLRDEMTVWPPEDDGQRHAALAHKRLCSMDDTRVVVSSPLRGENGDAIGALIIMDDKPDAPARVVRPLSASERSLATSLGALQRLEGGRMARFGRTAKRLIRSWKGKVAVAVVCLVLAAMAIPIPYRVNCDCQIEPVTRRFVAAPFEGTLEKAFVEPGDIVRQGDELARMDGREIRWERAGVVADRNQAEKKRDAAMADHDYAGAQIAKLEMERLALQIQLLDHRAEHLEVKSPVDGIVTSGDLERAEGAPLTVGQTLFEIAPLDKMIVEVAIADDEVSYVREGQPIVVRLDAYPGQTWNARLAKIQPRSEIRDQDNVFIAEAALKNSDCALQPGMKGQAAIVTPRRPIGWILFHKPWEYVVKTLRW